MQTTLYDNWGNVAFTMTCKAIVLQDDKVWLRKNERDEWELPGGRLSAGEQPEQGVVREISEELGVTLSNTKLLDIYIWEKEFGFSTHIAVATFTGNIIHDSGLKELKGESGKAVFKLFTVDEAMGLSNLPHVYKRSLKKL